MDPLARGRVGVEFAFAFVAKLADPTGAFPVTTLQLRYGFLRPLRLAKTRIVEAAKEKETPGIPAVPVDDGIEPGSRGVSEDRRPGNTCRVHRFHPLVDLRVRLRIVMTVQVGHWPGGLRYS